MIQTINKHLKQNIDIKLFDEVDSTNNVCKKIAKEGFNTTLVVTNSQTGGRGRLGRSFISASNKGIYMSLLIKPNISIVDVSKITCVVGCSILRVLKEYITDPIYLKWVNDLYLHDKKICGILTESKINNGSLEYVVIGIGLNLYKQVFPKDVNASSIEDETNIIIDKWELIGKIIDRVLLDIENINDIKHVNYFKNNMYLKDKEVLLKTVHGELKATVVGINEFFELIAKTSLKTINISSGEILRVIRY